MIISKPGDSFVAVLDTDIEGLVGELTVQLERPDASTVIEPTAEGIVEVEPGIYAKGDLIAPTDQGTYIVVWNIEGERASEELVVSEDLEPTFNQQALVSVTEARSYLGVKDAELPTDTTLQQIIAGLSLRTIQRTGRTYINSDDTDKATMRVFDFDPSKRVVAIDDCRELGAVEVTATPSAEDSWSEVDVEAFVAEPVGEAVVRRLRFLSAQELPAQGTGWGVLSAHVNQGGSLATPWPRRARAEIQAIAWLRVTAKWGYGPTLSSVPDNVKLAVLMWLQNIHKRDQAFFTDDFAKAVAGLAMPKDVAEMLDGEERATASVTAV